MKHKRGDELRFDDGSTGIVVLVDAPNRAYVVVKTYDTYRSAYEPINWTVWHDETGLISGRGGST